MNTLDRRFQVRIHMLDLPYLHTEVVHFISLAQTQRIITLKCYLKFHLRIFGQDKPVFQVNLGRHLCQRIFSKYGKDQGVFQWNP